VQVEADQNYFLDALEYQINKYSIVSDLTQSSHFLEKFEPFSKPKCVWILTTWLSVLCALPAFTFVVHVAWTSREIEQL